MYGFASAEKDGWGATITVGAFGVAAVLLATFVAVESRTAAPLLPLRVVTDRNRGGVYLGIGLAMTAMFAMFLFMALYLQQVKGYSPLLTGVAFLPMTICLTLGSTQIGARLMSRLPARRLMVPGLLATAFALVLLAQLGPDTPYWALVLPAQVILGIGLGTAFTPAMSLATHGVQPSDAGIASAMLNTAQQVGGSIGTALLNTLAASATSAYVLANAASGDAAEVARQAATHGYTTAFWWAAGFVGLAAAVIAAAVRTERPDSTDVTDSADEALTPALVR